MRERYRTILSFRRSAVYIRPSKGLTFGPARIGAYTRGLVMQSYIIISITSVWTTRKEFVRKNVWRIRFRVVAGRRGRRTEPEDFCEEMARKTPQLCATLFSQSLTGNTHFSVCLRLLVYVNEYNEICTNGRREKNDKLR